MEGRRQKHFPIVDISDTFNTLEPGSETVSLGQEMVSVHGDAINDTALHVPDLSAGNQVVKRGEAAVMHQQSPLAHVVNMFALHFKVEHAQDARDRLHAFGGARTADGREALSPAQFVGVYPSVPIQGAEGVEIRRAQRLARAVEPDSPYESVEVRDCAVGKVGGRIVGTAVPVDALPRARGATAIT